MIVDEDDVFDIMWPDYVYITDVSDEFGMYHYEFVEKLNSWLEQRLNKHWCNHLDYDNNTMTEVLYAQLKYNFK